MLGSPGLLEGLLDVLWSGDSDCFERLLRRWKRRWIEAFPLGMNFRPVVFTGSGHQIVRVAEGVSDLLELREGCSFREVDSLDDLSCNLVSHFALVPVCPELASMDVSPPKLHWNPLAPHVSPCMLPRYAPPGSN